MARPRSSPAANAVSLFPFLSILACVIGALTLIISALSMAQIAAGREDEDVKRAEDYVALQNRLADDRERLEKLRAEASGGAAQQAELARLKSDAARMRSELDELEKSETERQKLETRAEELAAQIDNLATGDAAMAEQIAAAESQLAALEEREREGRRVQILPSRGVSRIAPAFVEVAEAGLVLHTRTRSVEVARAAIATDENLRKLVEFAGRVERGTLVLLLRPEGHATYAAFRTVAQREGWPYAKLPIPAPGPIDLKLFNIDR